MKKSNIELDVDAYIKAFKKKPSTFSIVITALLSVWFFLLGLTAFTVLTKLMLEAWKWIL